MARPRSEDKRNAILEAATVIVAEQGVSAPTARIAKQARVAEGSLFTYFENKDALFQELYLHLKQDLARSVMPDYPHEAGYRQRMQHVFERYVNWGLANAAGRFALSRLSASGHILDDTRAQGMGPFLAISQMMEDAVRDGVLVDASIAFLSSIIEHIADTTIEYVDKHPESAERHLQLGFHVAWRAITV